MVWFLRTLLAFSGTKIVGKLWARPAIPAFSYNRAKLNAGLPGYNQSIGLSSHEYRDRVYIRKDIILKLTEYGELNQTSLLSYCGLNLVKHKDILDDMEAKGIIKRTEEPWGNKRIIKYSVTEKGREFCRLILDPYEEMFPRRDQKR